LIDHRTIAEVVHDYINSLLRRLPVEGKGDGAAFPGVDARVES
jgi:hypothetical protein